MSERTRAVIFGDDAGSYEKSRPDYPAETLAHVADLVAASTAVEVGAGTGKATAGLARSGLRSICVEPSAEMAAILAAKELPGVEVVVSTFEDWVGPDGPVDLVYAAQSWHWVDRAIGYEKALSMLRPGGALALVWSIPVDRYDEFGDVYARHAPHLLTDQDERIRRRDSHDWLDDMAAAGFADLETFTHEWSADLTGAELRSLYSTYSDHMLLPEPTRTALLDDLETEVGTLGGSVRLAYRTVVFSGRA
jgi:SAM-dependent methyltransferase